MIVDAMGMGRELDDVEDCAPRDVDAVENDRGQADRGQSSKLKTESEPNRYKHRPWLGV